MLFSSLSLKVLVGLGALVGASVLSINLKSKDTETNTGTLNSKQGEAVITPLKPEAVVTPEQAAKKEIADLEDRIDRLDTKISKKVDEETILIQQTIPRLKEAKQKKEDQKSEDQQAYTKSSHISTNIPETLRLDAKANKSLQDYTEAKEELSQANEKLRKLKDEIRISRNNRIALRPYPNTKSSI